MNAKEKMALELSKINGNSVTVGNNESGLQTHTNAPKTVLDYIRAMTPEISKALPLHIKPERLIRVVLTEIRRNPKLMECSRDSLLGALMLSAQLGLEPSPLGHCYYIPYNNRKAGIMECQFMIGYRGMIDLAMRSDKIESIVAETVCQNDLFDFQYGLNPNLMHKPALINKGSAYAYYTVVKFRGGGFHIKVMGIEEIERFKKRSQSAQYSSSPWVTDYDEMAKKTVIRSIFRYLPVSNEIMTYAGKDSVVKTSLIEDEGETCIDIQPSPLTEQMPSQPVNINQTKYDYAVDTAAAA